MTMLPRLQAEEKLNSINTGVLSSGFADRKDVTKAVGRLEALADGGRRKFVKPTAATLAQIGIAVVTVPTAPKAGGTDDG
ncbi:hypothetical protein ABWH98_05460 [Labrenzia sp. ac12]